MPRKAKPAVEDGPGVVPQEYEMVPIDAIQPHPRNCNQGDQGAIIESIRHNRFYGACDVQRSTSLILAGKHRWLAAKECGLKMIPVIWQDVDDAEALRIMLSDNRTSRLGTDEPNALAELLQSIQNDTGSLAGTGYDGDALQELLDDLAKPFLPEEPGADQTGDIKEQFQVLVTCTGEAQQAALLDDLNKQGYTCRALIS